MARNNCFQVFKGGWEELQNAVFTTNVQTTNLPTNPESFYINKSGTRIHFLANGSVQTHLITLPFYDPNKIAVAVPELFMIAEDSNPVGLCFNDDETEMYVVGVSTKRLYQYSLPVAGNPDSIVDPPTSISLSVLAGDPRQCVLSRDGDFMFITSISSIHSFPLPVKDDITSNVSNTFIDTIGMGIASFGLAFKSEGDKMYIGDVFSNTIIELDLSPVNIITSAVPNGNTLPLGSVEPFGISFRSNGKQFFILDMTTKNFARYHLDDFDTDWNISTASLFTNSLAAVDSQSIFWKPDGTKFLSLVSSAADRIDEFTVTKRWNQTGATITGSFTLAGIADIPRGIWVTPDGTSCYVVDNATDSLIRLNMSTGWSLSTMSDPGISFDLSTQATNPTGIAFSKDELTFYITDSTTDDVFQYNIPTTPLDIANAVFSGNSLDLSSFGNTTDIRLKPDDNLMYIAERSGDRILLFRLPVDGNVANSVFLDELSVGFLESNLQGFFIRENDGKKIWIVGIASGLIQSMDMTLEFNNAIITNFGEDLTTGAGETLVYA